MYSFICIHLFMYICICVLYSHIGIVLYTCICRKEKLFKCFKSAVESSVVYRYAAECCCPALNSRVSRN